MSKLQDSAWQNELWTARSFVRSSREPSEQSINQSINQSIEHSSNRRARRPSRARRALQGSEGRGATLFWQKARTSRAPPRLSLSLSLLASSLLCSLPSLPFPSLPFSGTQDSANARPRQSQSYLPPTDGHTDGVVWFLVFPSVSSRRQTDRQTAERNGTRPRAGRSFTGRRGRRHRCRKFSFLSCLLWPPDVWHGIRPTVPEC